jgi:hypothetical protein
MRELVDMVEKEINLTDNKELVQKIKNRVIAQQITQ